MGQYWKPVNLDKREFIDPHRLGCGLKLWEQLANQPGVGSALTILCAAMPAPRGGGDFDLTKNWHGPERTFPEHNMSPGPMAEGYAEVAKRTIGRWAGDRIALVGDYAMDSDLAAEHEASGIYERCISKESAEKYPEENANVPLERRFADVTDDVCRVIEHELNGHFVGDGWRDFKGDEEA